MKIAIVIPAYNRRDITINCLHQITKTNTSGLDIKTIVVDDGSTDGTVEMINDIYPNIVILRGNGNLWWGGAINMGTKYALEEDSDYIMWLNDDLELGEDFLYELYKVAKDNPEALVSSLKLGKNELGKVDILTSGFTASGRLQEMQDPYGGCTYEDGMFSDVLEVDALTGASTLIPRIVFHKIGLLDINNFPHHWADIEFTRRAALAGFPCLVATKSRIYTDRSPNYHTNYLVNSTRWDYLRNMFNNKKYTYGFRSLQRYAYLHKPFLPGTILYVRKLLGAVKWLFLKLILPHERLRVLVSKTRH